MDRSFQGMRDVSLHGTAAWPASGRRNAFVMRNNRTSIAGSSRMSVSGRSSQSIQVITRTRLHDVKLFGLPLPVLVTEALTFADRSTAVSAHISPDGWAWLVCGRRLLIWQYKQTPAMAQQRRPPSTQCRELTLPASELAHRADLVWVYAKEDSVVPSCIAVSPEGSVRYWPSVAYEGTSVEDSTDLQGQECDSLTSISSLGCILATTTSTIVRLQPEVINGRHCVTCTTLKPPQSILGGIGRRMSSLIFGSLPTAGGTEAKLVRVAAVEKTSCNKEQTEFIVYVLTEHTLQKWSVTPHDVERLIWECEVGRRIREAFQEKVWDPQGGNPDEQESWLLDMQPTSDGVAILAASVHPQISQNMQFAIATLSTDLGVPPTRLKSFTPLKNEVVPRKTEQDLSQYQLLIAGHSALVFSQRNVLVFPLSNLSDEPDAIEFRNEGDRLLGGSVCANVPVFFSKSHGLVAISPLDYSPHDFSSQNDSIAFGADVSVSECGDTSVLEQDLEELTTQTQNVDARMKAAFLYHVSKNQAQCEALVRELFPRNEIQISDIDSPLDVAVVKVSQDLIDDIPARDPRWVEMKTSNISLSSSTSLHILRQVEQKQHALDLFFNFLVDLKLWERLSAVVSFGVVMATTHVLAEQAEKLVAAIALHQLQSEHGTSIETAIRLALDMERERPTGKLNAKDLFYRKVSGIQRAIQVLVKWSEDQVHSERSPAEVARQLSEINEIILEVVRQVIQYRQQKEEIFQPNNHLEVGLCEYLPWTASAGPGGLRDALLKQQSLTLKFGARSTGDPKLKAKLYDQVLNIIDIILDGKKCHLESVRGSNKFTVLFEQYQKVRSNLIEPFVEDREYERAVMLAEKYYDFKTLVQICEITNNRERLDVYIEKFKDQDFSQFLFSWYIQEQKPGRLLETFRAGSGLSAAAQNASQQAALKRFLGDHPSLSWLQHVFLNDFQTASDTLSNLAQQETELLRRKKSMLSLAKLALLASGETEARSDQRALLDAELDLVAHQEDLPESVLVAHGYDIDTLHVLPPGELIQLLICNENQSADEYTFKKALDLLKYEENQKSELRLKIWCQAILRDTWLEADADIPLNVVQKTVFYKLVALIVFMDITGQSLKELVPSKDRLLDAIELEKLPDYESFKYLISIAYEHFEIALAE